MEATTGEDEEISKTQQREDRKMKKMRREEHENGGEKEKGARKGILGGQREGAVVVMKRLGR